MDNGFNDNGTQQEKLQRMKSCQTLTMIALIGAPVSLLIGGVALSTVALVCGIIAFVRMRKIITPADVPGSVERTLYVQSIIGLGLGIVAMTMNLVAFVYMFGAIMDAVQSGDPSKLLDSMGNAAQPDASSGKSVWD